MPTQTLFINLNALGMDQEVAEQINFFGDDVAKVIEHMFKELGLTITIEATHPMNFNEEDSKAADEARGPVLPGELHGQFMKLSLHVMDEDRPA